MRAVSYHCLGTPTLSTSRQQYTTLELTLDFITSFSNALEIGDSLQPSW